MSKHMSPERRAVYIDRRSANKSATVARKRARRDKQSTR